MSKITLGIYEKALRSNSDWNAFFASAVSAGFDFLDLSVDESTERQERLHWSAAYRQRVRTAAAQEGLKLGGVCLSAHRRVAPGSADPQTRQKARKLLLKGLRFCEDLGIPLLQLAGYYAYYETPFEEAQSFFHDFLCYASAEAARSGVLLGIENVDTSGITSISAAAAAAQAVDSPWLQLYPDIGNLAEQRLEAVPELRAGRGRMLALHVKDTRPGEPRRVPMGQGDVPWDLVFAELRKQNWSGRMMIEMWNDDAPDSAAAAAAARSFIAERLKQADIEVATA